MAYDLSCAQADGARSPEVFDAALGNLALLTGDEEAAARFYQAALTRQPEMALAHSLLGGLRLRQGRLDEALAALQRAVAADPDSAQAQAQLGEVLSRQEKWAQAAEAFGRAVARAPAFANLVGLGRAHLEQRRFVEAYEAYERALKSAPLDADVAALQGALGIAAFNFKQFPRAIDHLERALQLAPSLGTRFALGIVLDAAGDTLRAAGLYDQVVGEDPTLGEAQVRLAGARIKLGQFAAARDASLRFAEVAEGRPALARDLAAIRRAVAEAVPLPVERGRR